jgi:hypothetical protein
MNKIGYNPQNDLTMGRPKVKDKKVTMSITINDIVNEKLEKYLEEKRLSKSEYVQYLIEKDIKEKQ